VLFKIVFLKHSNCLVTDQNSDEISVVNNPCG